MHSGESVRGLLRKGETGYISIRSAGLHTDIESYYRGHVQFAGIP